MITHSPACERAWAFQTGTVGPDPHAWHFTCTEDCVDDAGRHKPDFSFPHEPYDFPETPMPERHEVSVTNTVQQVVQLGRDIVLEKEDRTTRTLFFDDLETANAFISGLAEPEPQFVERDPGRCASTYGRDGPRCVLRIGHAATHTDNDTHWYGS